MFSETEMRAARIAASIEGDTKSLYYTELENGDEEEAFRSVSKSFIQFRSVTKPFIQ